MMKAYKLEMLIVDHDDLGASGVREAIENQRFANDAISPHVMAIAERDIGEWDDSHPLNHYSKMQAEYQRLFSLDQPEQVDAESVQKGCRKDAERDLPPLPELTILGTSRYGSIFLGYTADQMRERDAMWQARINALLSKQAPVTLSDEELKKMWRDIFSNHLSREAAAVDFARRLLSSAQPSRDQVQADHDRLVRELDVLLNGEEGAAKQASLCDIVSQVRRQGIRALGAQPSRDQVPVKPAVQWQPIETAPKHTEVLCWRDDQGVFIAELTTPDGVMSDSEIEACNFPDDFEEWFHIGWGWLEGELKPTRWMPLPAAPDAAAPDSKEAKQEPAMHDLYKPGDKDAPDAIKNEVGEIVLGLCRTCGKGEADLAKPCTPNYKKGKNHE